MTDYTVKNDVLAVLHHFIFKINFFLLFFLKKRRSRVFVLLFFSSCLLLHQQVKAQDSLSDSDEDVTSDTEKLESTFDTTGYYFSPKENVADAYTQERIKVRVSSDTTIQRLRDEDDFWYVKSIEDFKKNVTRLRYDRKYRDSLKKEGLLPPDEQVFTQEQSSNEWYMQQWFNNLIWIVIISIFAAAVIYFLLSKKISLFSNSSARVSGEEITSEENLFNTNYDLLLTKYTEEKNYRLAVRVLYLQLLKMLSERQIITFQPQFTNTHYLQQIVATHFYHDFFTVTRHYEYIWYGEFSVTESTFQKINSDFTNMKKEVLRK